MNNHNIIGLTGGIGAGKSTVSAILAKRGFYIIDADIITRTLHHSKEICAQTASVFGPDILTSDSQGPCILRPALAALVFQNPDKLSILNSIMQPAIRSEALRLIHISLDKSPKTPIILDAALLFEAHWDELCETAVAVICPDTIRAARTAARDRVPIEAVFTRMRAQTSDDVRIKKADRIIYNVGSMPLLISQIDAVFGN